MEVQKLWTKRFLLGTGINFLLVLNYYLLMIIMTDYAAGRYQASSALAGLSASIFVIGALLARFISAQLMDKMGQRNVLILSALLETAMSALYFWSVNLGILFVVRLMHGLSYGMASMVVSTIVTGSIAKERHGEGIGYFMLSITLGAAIGPFLGMFLLQHGYSYIFAVCTIIACLCLLAALLFDKADFKNIAHTRLVNGSKGKGLESLFEIKALPISVVCAGIYFCYSSIISFLTPYSASIHLQRAAAFFFIVYSVVILVTRPFTGKMFDKKGARVTMLPAFAAFFIGMILLSQAGNGAILLISAAFLGFGIGVIQSCGLAVAVQKSPAERISYANSTFYIFLDVGTGAGPLFLGFLIPAIGYRGMYLAMAGLTVLFAVIFFCISKKISDNL